MARVERNDEDVGSEGGGKGEKARIEQRLERLRQKLLDLSTTNRMLSYRHPKASCLRVVDELPHQLFEVLHDGATLTFEPVPEPTQRELDAYNATRPDQVNRAQSSRVPGRPDAPTWARHLGLDVNYDLPVETDTFERLEHHDDRKIQTLHYPDDLDARLRKIRAAGRTAIEESGANMLYIAFGFLEWREQQTSKAHQAPLVMLPVELEREPTRGGQYRTRVRWTGEELQPNLSLKKKLEELNIDLPALEEDQSLETYLRDVTRAIRHKADWAVRRYVTLGLFEFGKILLYLDLAPDRWPSFSPLAGRPMVKELLGDDADEPREGGGGTWSADPDNSPEASLARDLELEVVDRADSSQCEALEVALGGRNLVIQGPPGTGKSQTITNLVAAAMARGKTVLFVAEKLAALEVVRRRMRELGLGDFCLELHSHKTRKAEVLEDIAARIRASAKIRPPKDYQGALTRLSDRREKLGAYIDVVSQPAAALVGISISDALMKAGQARRKLGPDVKAVEALRSYFPSPDTMTWAQLADAKGRLRQVASAVDDLGLEGSAFGHVWAGVSSTVVLPQDRDRVADLARRWADCVDELASALEDKRLKSLPLSEIAAATTALAAIAERRADWLAADSTALVIETALGVTIGRSSASVVVFQKVIEAAALAPLDDLKLRNSALLSPGASARLKDHQKQLEELKASREELGASFRDAAYSEHVDDLEEWAAALSQRSLFARFGRRWRAAINAVNTILRPGSLTSKPREKAAKVAALRKDLLTMQEVEANFAIEAMVGPTFSDLATSVEAHIRIADWADQTRQTLDPGLSKAVLELPSEAISLVAALPGTEALQRIAGMEFDGSASTFWTLGVEHVAPPAIAAIAIDAVSDTQWSELIRIVDSGSVAARNALEAERAFAAATGLDEEYWFGEGGRPHLEGVASQARLAAEHAELLPGWLDFDRAFKLSNDHLEAPIAVAGADGSVPTKALETALDFLVFDTIARQAFAANPGLLSASGKSLDALRSEYASIDAEVMELRRAHIAAKLLTNRAPEGRSSGRKADLTEMALLRAELAKQKRHIPIRQLVNRAGKAIQALKPCFMMGPLSVAQYIAPGTLKFDLVIMDEASQMRPEDAIGALARGGQAVIVGDTKQLPPTSFFDRIADGASDDEDEEMTLAEDAKSVLELAEAIFTPRMLKWHYRSRHESLIAFSNKNFYSNDLIVFPSPSGQNGRFGLGWNYLDQGTATSGVNPVEARAVAKAAAIALLNDRRRSLGVVAMNIKQAQRISDELQALAKGDPVLAKVLNEAETSIRGEPFFIKNLENVQGDERDVIMISMTYGPPTPGGRVPQNFGPINFDTGWRRLNVLFTRAKERMEVFSSMRASDIIPKEGGDRGQRSLKLFLDYAETGRQGEVPRTTDRDPDNDFEDAVIEGLRELNFQCVPQVGVANFYLDIGVCDPNAPHEYVAAIECDGATYHSSPSARDRDRLRQEILENLGWNIIRIWSTDWFRDPDAELARVSAELRRLIAASAEARAGPKPAQVQISVEPTRQGTFDLPPATPRPSARAAAHLSDGLSTDQARAELVDLRENTIKVEFPDADPARGLLRKSMLDELLRKRPKDRNEFLAKIPIDLRQGTDADQLKKFGETVFEILERTS